METVTPNLYQLSGHHLHVTYTTTSIDGKPTLTYHDAHQNRSFRGVELNTVETPIGKLVSVTLNMVPDLGSTTFSLLVPPMQIPQASSASVKTYCITTLHRTSLMPRTLHGQLATYTEVALHGSAQFVVS